MKLSMRNTLRRYLYNCGQNRVIIDHNGCYNPTCGQNGEQSSFLDMNDDVNK